MASLDVTISGVLYDKLSRTSRPCVLIGEASLTGLGVGGGPMPPGEGKPPGIWGGPIDPYPDHGLPEQPPKPPEGTPDDDGFIKPPPADGGWGYHEDHGWLYKPGAAASGPKTAA